MNLSELLKEQLESLSTFSPVGIWKSDSLGNCVYINNRMTELTGLTREEALGPGWLNGVHPEDRTRISKEWNQAVQTGNLFSSAFRFRKKDGSHSWVYDQGIPERDPEGKIRGFIGTLVDIKDRMRMEAQVPEWEGLLTGLLSQIWASISFVDRDLRIKFHNQYFERMLGISSEQIVGKTLREVMGTQNFEQLDPHVKNALRGKPAEFEARLVLNEEKVEGLFAANFLPMVDRGDRTLGFFLLLQKMTQEPLGEKGLFNTQGDLESRMGARTRLLNDANEKLVQKISQLEQAKHVLGTSEKQMRLITDSLPVLIGYLDPRERYLFINKSYEEWFDLGRDQFLGKHIREIKGEAAYQAIRNSLRLALSGAGVAFESWLPFKKPGKRFVRSNYIPDLDDQGQVQGIILLTQDIMENYLNQERMQEKSQQFRNLAKHLVKIRETEKVHIAREIHDDLGATLTALKIDMENLLKSDFKISDDLKDIHYSLGQLVDRCISSVKNISSKLRPAMLDVMGLKGAIEDYAEDFQTRTGIKCKTFFSRKIRDLDKDRSLILFRIMQECLTNISRHSKATQAEIHFKVAKKVLVLEIRDNGVGMDVTAVDQSDSYGMQGIAERVALLDGEWHIKATPSRGTRVKAVVPFDE
ncbi:MAG: hypothetical protein COV67_02715 [Nitrospinae bacterium CG11_big_fil_rev_8_21_14_0_20_56_8]|nr:MAG: hypothetical protein COV67_02715 [Nitrospinae bacterium CG11_big_fil_rev_8_21_14_0_20_56_8]